MVTTYGSKFDRGPRMDWRAAFVVILFHVGLAVWFFGQHWKVPTESGLAALVLVELWEPSRPKDVAIDSSELNTAAGHRSSATPHTQAVRAPQHSRRRPQPQNVVPEGAEPVRSTPGTITDVTTPGTVAGVAGSGAAASFATTGDGASTKPRFRPPRVLHRVRPDYPADAFEDHREGSVDVMVTVATTGRLKDAHVYQSSGTPSLDDAAVEAVRAYEFSAAERNGKPTEAQAIVTIDWKIGPATANHIAIVQPNRLFPASAKAVGKHRLCVATETNAELCQSTTAPVADRTKR